MSFLKRFSSNSPPEPGVEIMPINGISLSQDKTDSFIVISIINVNNLNTNLVEGFIEIRLFKHNLPTYDAIYLTENQYNWMMKHIKDFKFYKIWCPIVHKNLMNTSNFKIKKRSGFKKGFKLTQTVNGQKRIIKLNNHEVNILISKCSTFDFILDIFESKLSSNL